MGQQNKQDIKVYYPPVEREPILLLSFECLVDLN